MVHSVVLHPCDPRAEVRRAERMVVRVMGDAGEWDEVRFSGSQHAMRPRDACDQEGGLVQLVRHRLAV